MRRCLGCRANDLLAAIRVDMNARAASVPVAVRLVLQQLLQALSVACSAGCRCGRRIGPQGPEDIPQLPDAFLHELLQAIHPSVRHRLGVLGLQ